MSAALPRGNYFSLLHSAFCPAARPSEQQGFIRYAIVCIKQYFTCTHCFHCCCCCCCCSWHNQSPKCPKGKSKKKTQHGEEKCDSNLARHTTTKGTTMVMHDTVVGNYLCGHRDAVMLRLRCGDAARCRWADTTGSVCRPVAQTIFLSHGADATGAAAAAAPHSKDDRKLYSQYFSTFSCTFSSTFTALPCCMLLHPSLCTDRYGGRKGN